MNGTLRDRVAQWHRGNLTAAVLILQDESNYPEGSLGQLWARAVIAADEKTREWRLTA
jgi:hypothetical protein